MSILYCSNYFPFQKNKLNTNSEIENIPWSCDIQERHWSYLECQKGLQQPSNSEK